MTEDYGNTAWQVFVVAAYLSTALLLGGYAVFQWRERRRCVELLKEEGHLDDGS